MGVVIRKWVWLECIGVVKGGVYIVILLIPTPLALVLIAAVSLLLCSFLKCFFIL